MNLKDLATRADRVFRGTVIGVDTGTVRAGGSELPTVTYKLRVDETFKGEYSVVKDDTSYVEVRMVGTKTEGAMVNGRQHFSVFRDVPRLQMGSDYVLFNTARSDALVGITQGNGATDPGESDLSDAFPILSGRGTRYELFVSPEPFDLSFEQFLFLPLVF